MHADDEPTFLENGERLVVPEKHNTPVTHSRPRKKVSNIIPFWLGISRALNTQAFILAGTICKAFALHAASSIQCSIVQRENLAQILAQIYSSKLCLKTILP